MSRDYGKEAQAAAEAHLDAVYEYAFDNSDPDAEDPAYAPFCGCQTCVVREVLASAWPVIEEWAKSMDEED